MKKTFTVSFNPLIRHIYVTPSTIISTTNPKYFDEFLVVYKPNTLADNVLMVSVLLIAMVVILQFGFFGLVTGVSLLLITRSVVKRREKMTRYQLEQLLPKELVVEIVREVYKLCCENAQNTIIEKRDVAFKVVCGRYGKCIEIDRRNITIFSFAVLFFATLLLLADLVANDLRVFGVIGMLGSLAFLAKLKLCKKYTVIPLFTQSCKEPPNEATTNQN